MSDTECALEITDIALPDSFGVGKRDNLVIFVPGAVTGDKVRVRIAKPGKRFAFGQIVEIETASPFRTTPLCQHFGVCGGCSLQNVIYEKQLEIKENYLRQTLKRIGSIDVENTGIDPIAPSPEQWFYRTRLDLAFGMEQGHQVLGLRERLSPLCRYAGRVVHLDQCPIFSSVAEKIIPIAREFVRTSKVKAYDPIGKRGLLRHLTLRETKQTGEIMVILETTAAGVPDLKKFWQAMVSEVPAIKSFYLTVNDRSDDVIRYDRAVHLFGSPSIEERLGPFRFKIYPASFLQPNIRAAERLYEMIGSLSCLAGHEHILGLYCGMGPIEIYLAGMALRVTGIDSVPANILNARENCLLNDVKNCLFYEGAIEKVLEEIDPGSIDLLVTDPPRGGISAKGLAHISSLNPRKIAYISCSPPTLARDLKYLTGQGYVVSRIIPFDFFPHTGHMEALVVLTR